MQLANFSLVLSILSLLALIGAAYILAFILNKALSDSWLGLKMESFPSWLETPVMACYILLTFVDWITWIIGPPTYLLLTMAIFMLIPSMMVVITWWDDWKECKMGKDHS